MNLIDFIICDDIRHEQGNKISVMGIYTESINLNLPPDIKWPFPFRLAAYLRIEFDEIDPIPDKFSVKISQNDKSLAQLEGIINPFGTSHTLALPFVINPLPLNGFGVLRIDVEVFKGNEVLLAGTHSIQVIKASAPKV